MPAIRALRFSDPPLIRSPDVFTRSPDVSTRSADPPLIRSSISLPDPPIPRSFDPPMSLPDPSITGSFDPPMLGALRVSPVKRSSLR
jgi:hypothetical protein